MNIPWTSVFSQVISHDQTWLGPVTWIFCGAMLARGLRDSRRWARVSFFLRSRYKVAGLAIYTPSWARTATIWSGVLSANRALLAVARNSFSSSGLNRWATYRGLPLRWSRSPSRRQFWIVRRLSPISRQVVRSETFSFLASSMYSRISWRSSGVVSSPRPPRIASGVFF